MHTWQYKRVLGCLGAVLKRAGRGRVGSIELQLAEARAESIPDALAVLVRREKSVREEIAGRSAGYYLAV